MSTVPALDLRINPDLGTRWALSSGNTCLAEDLICALSSDEGSLIYAPGWGYNVLRQLNGTFTRTRIAQLNSRITAECLKNPKVQACSTQTVYDVSTNSLTITLGIEAADGPFTLVLLVSQLSVAVLNAQEVGLPAAQAPASTTPVLQGPPGAPGAPGPGSSVPGPPGPAGTSNQSFGDSSQPTDDSGIELVWWQFSVNMANQPAGTLTLDITLLGSSDSGTAEFKAYVGGSFVTSLGVPPTGSLVASATRSGAGFISLNLNGTFTNPTGIVPIQVTMKSAGGAGNFAKAQALNGMVIA